MPWYFPVEAIAWSLALLFIPRASQIADRLNIGLDRWTLKAVCAIPILFAGAGLVLTFIPPATEVFYVPFVLMAASAYLSLPALRGQAIRWTMGRRAVVGAVIANLCFSVFALASAGHV